MKLHLRCIYTIYKGTFFNLTRWLPFNIQFQLNHLRPTNQKFFLSVEKRSKFSQSPWRFAVKPPVFFDPSAMRYFQQISRWRFDLLHFFISVSNDVGPSNLIQRWEFYAPQPLRDGATPRHWRIKKRKKKREDQDEVKKEESKDIPSVVREVAPITKTFLFPFSVPPFLFNAFYSCARLAHSSFSLQFPYLLSRLSAAS